MLADRIFTPNNTTTFELGASIATGTTMGDTFNLYPVWAPLNSRLFFNPGNLPISGGTFSGGGDGNGATFLVYKTPNSTISLPTKDSYFFCRGFRQIGWTTLDVTGGAVHGRDDVTYEFVKTYDANVDITFYPIWLPQVYTAVLHFVGGPDSTLLDGIDAVLPFDPMMTTTVLYTIDEMNTAASSAGFAFTFGGWFTTPDCDPASEISLTGSDFLIPWELGDSPIVHVYAKWVES